MTTDFPLRPDERVLWSGQPDRQRVLTGVDVFWIPFSLIWTTAGVVLALRAPGGAGVVAGVMIIVAGAFIIGGRFFVKARMKRATRYTLTNIRAIIQRRRETYEFTLESGSPRVEVLRRGKHCTLKFTSDDPRSYGRVTSEMFANTGLDFTLRPGRELRFAFHDIVRTNDFDTAVDDLLATGNVLEGIA